MVQWLKILPASCAGQCSCIYTNMYYSKHESSGTAQPPKHPGITVKHTTVSVLSDLWLHRKCTVVHFAPPNHTLLLFRVCRSVMSSKCTGNVRLGLLHVRQPLTSHRNNKNSSSTNKHTGNKISTSTKRSTHILIGCFVCFRVDFSFNMDIIEAVFIQSKLQLRQSYACIYVFEPTIAKKKKPDQKKKQSRKIHVNLRVKLGACPSIQKVLIIYCLLLTKSSFHSSFHM